MKTRSLFGFAGTLDRVPFLVVGVGLFLLKYSIDSSVAHLMYARPWSPWDYLVTSVPLTSLTRLTDDAGFHLTLLGISIPFIAVGVVLTLARLRSAGMPGWLVVAFFLPVINLLFFLLLTVAPALRPARVAEDTTDLSAPTAPAAPTVPTTAGGQQPTSFAAAPPEPLPVLRYGRDAEASYRFRRWLPKHKWPSLWASALVPVPFGLLLTWLATRVFREYGLGVFVALPFTQGLLAAALHGARRRRSMGQAHAAALLCGLMTTVATFTFAIEGLGCLIMLLPLALPVMVLGGTVGYALQAGGGTGSARESAERRRPFLCVAVAVPLLMAAERLADRPAEVYAVTTAVEVDAPPVDVWRHVIRFGRMEPPDEWVFRLGVAHPVRATIDGAGVGVVRRCEFSTGAFVEPITVWDEPTLLKFDVTSNPPAMREYSPWNVHTPHVDDFLVSHGGQFHLVPIANGTRTRLEGTTWYEHNLWPAGYWRVWSDFILHRIHGRVLKHVKGLAESSRRAPSDSQ